MKYVISISGFLLLGLCLFFLLNSPTKTVVKTAEASDLVVKTTEKSEREVVCLAHFDGKKVFHIDHIWLVNEYQSGKIITETRQDTLLTEMLPQGKPCPGHIAEVTMR